MIAVSEKKLEYFNRAVRKEVEAKKRQTRQQLANEFNCAVAQAVADTQAETHRQVQAQNQALTRIANKRVAEATTEVRRSLAYLQERLTAQLFDGIKADVVAFTQSAEYEDFLVSGIKAAVGRLGYAPVYVQIVPDDMRFKTAVEEGTGLTVELGDSGMLGGFRLLDEKRYRVEEYSFQAGITAARQEFIVGLGV